MHNALKRMDVTGPVGGYHCDCMGTVIGGSAITSWVWLTGRGQVPL